MNIAAGSYFTVYETMEGLYKYTFLLLSSVHVKVSEQRIRRRELNQVRSLATAATVHLGTYAGFLSKYQYQ